MTLLQKSKLCIDCTICNQKSELFRLLNEEETQIINQERYGVHFKTGENIVKQGTLVTHITNVVRGFTNGVRNLLKQTGYCRYDFHVER